MFLEQSGNRIGFGEGFKSMTINLKQLSKLLKLSPTTVSRALADYPDVSAKTRARVVNWRIRESRCADILELDLSSQANR